MAITFVVAKSAPGSGTNNGSYTTAAADMSTANLLIHTHGFLYFGSPAFSDSQTNSYVDLGLSPQAGGCMTVGRYVGSPSVGASHTASMSGSWNCAGVFAGFAGVLAATPLDQTNGAAIGSSVNNLQPGSITPSVAGCLVITAVTFDGAQSGQPSISGGWIIPSNAFQNQGPGDGHCFAYQIQTTATAVNPTWTLDTASTNISAIIASFKPAAGGGATSSTKRQDPLASQIARFRKEPKGYTRRNHIYVPNWIAKAA